MSRHLAVTDTLAQLERLRGTVADFRAREQKLRQEFRLRTGAAHQQFTAATEQEEARLAAELARVEAAFASRQQAARAQQERRAARIVQARQADTKRALERADQDEGQQKYQVQTGLLDTVKNRKAALAANDAAYQEFQARLTEVREAFVVLEQRAERAFRGYRQFRDLLAHADRGADPDPAQDEHQLLQHLGELHAQTEANLKRFGRLPGPALFKLVSFWLLLVLVILAHGALVPALRYFQVSGVTSTHAAVSLAITLSLLVVLFFTGRRQARPLAGAIATALERARRCHNAALEKAAARHQQEIARIEQEAQSRTQALNEQWERAVQEAAARREQWPRMVEERAARLAARLAQRCEAQQQAIEREQAAAVAQLRETSAARRRPLIEAHEKQMAQFEADQQARWQALAAEWQARLQPVFETLRTAGAAAAEDFPEWRPERWTGWAPPAHFGHAARFGHLDVDVAPFCGGLPENAHLALPGPARLSVPLVLVYPRQGSILFETTRAGSEAVAGALNNLILRLLSQAPPGRLNFTIIDPVKLGQNFAGVMHLADYEESLVNRRIWTQSSEIEQRLADLNEHMEKVIQMYLRNEYATITDYNAQAGSIAEKYHFLVIADFPVNFSETAIRRLVNIAASGARCGVYTLIHWDRRQPLPPEFVLDELRRSSVVLSSSGQKFVLAGLAGEGTKLTLDEPPPPELVTELLHQIGQAGRNANRVEVPFAQVAPPEPEVWSLDTTEEIQVPIGRTGATKLQYLALGKGTRQHALVAGKTGSGKSTLFHVIITNLALWCSPEQIEFYLVDFKKGVEFKCYATHRLPHARVVAIESDREFGLSVLQRVDEELRRRGDLFRALGVQDLAGYKRAGGTEPMPRALLIIDEFQEFFVEDDRVSQGAAVLLDRIVRQGRAFGIHVLLGSQTLGGAYTLARSTLGQMVVRIALQCNEADAYLIMDENNPAPRLLSRPGEGIYNDLAGLIEGNSPFQTVWLPDEERENRLRQIRARADQRAGRRAGPFVFEGNAPADVRENPLLHALLETSPTRAPAAARLWLGAPNSIKGPTEAVLHRQSGNHLLIVGQREEAALALVGVGLVSLAAQYPRAAARLMLLDSTPPDSAPREFLQRITQAIPHPLTVGRSGDLADLLGELADEMRRRTEDESAAQAPATFLFILGLQNFKKLRQEEDFGFNLGESETAARPATLLNDLICGGGAVGLHVIATCDTYNNVTRYLGRKALSEFEMRVLFQMSANDSASLIDNPKASTLGLHRALFYNEHEGYLETFRPYALPDRSWIEQVAASLARRPR